MILGNTPMSKPIAPNTTQIGGSHYEISYKPWDFFYDIGLDFFHATAIKYITRWRDKNGIQDLQKALHYIDKILSLRALHTSGSVHLSRRSSIYIDITDYNIQDCKNIIRFCNQFCKFDSAMIYAILFKDYNLVQVELNTLIRVNAINKSLGKFC